jgi:tetratricopeptide (TPR) repeat protein
VLLVPLQRIYLLVRSVGSERLIERATSLAEGVGRVDYFLTELRVVARYLGLLVLPVGQTLEHDVRLSHSLFELRVLAAGALLAALFGLGCWLAWWPARGRGESAGEPARSADPAWRLAGFGILWFFLCLAVESTFIPIPDPMLEHRLYLPSAGFFLAVTLATALAGRAAGGNRRRLALLALLVLPLAGAAHARNLTWAEPRRFWYDMLAKSPEKARVVYNVGYFELQQGKRDVALELFGKTVALDPAYVSAWIWIGNLERARGRLDEAARAYQRAIELDPKNWISSVDLRTVRLRQGDFAEADRLWREAVRVAGSESAVVELLRKAGSEALLPENLPKNPAPLAPRPPGGGQGAAVPPPS